MILKNLTTFVLFSHLHIASQMQEYGGGTTSKPDDFREGAQSRDCGQESFHAQHQHGNNKKYGCSNRELSNQNITSYGRVATGIYEATTSQQYQTQVSRNNKTSAPTFSSPPNSPLVGLIFDQSSPSYTVSTVMAERLNADRRNSWSISHQEPIGTGAKKKIVKSQDKRNAYSADNRYLERYKDISTDTERPRNKDRNLTSESTSSLDFFTEGERMVSELCNIPDPNSRHDTNNQKSHQKRTSKEEDKNKAAPSSDIFMTALDKIIIHDQIPNQIVQLAIEACTDAENIAIAHHNRPCFKNIHSICAKTRSNVQKPDSAVANLHSQGIPWVIKNFIFSFVRILDGWKGVKELLSEKHDTFSRIENKYYSQNIRECFVQWQAVTKEMLTHIYKTFKCLDQGFTMEQKSFTHNYYATNSALPRHQNQSKFQPIKSHVSTPRPINASPQPYNVIQPHWVQNQTQAVPQNYSDSPWFTRPNVTYKKIPVVPPPNSQNFYPLNEHNDDDNYQKSQYKCDPCIIREAKPRQSWTITNVPDFRTLEGICHDQRDLYTQLKHKMDAELGKSPIQTNTPCDLLQRRDMELKAKMIPLSHVEKTLIPSMASTTDIRSCYVQKNNSCGDTKEKGDFFATWGQMVQKESNDFLTHHTHNVQIPSSVVTISSNISGPVQFVDLENDEFHEISKVYMKPGSYKVPIKPAEPMSPFIQSVSQDVVYDSHAEDSSLNVKVPFSQVTLAPQPKYNIESWPCLMSRRAEEIFINDQKCLAKPSVPCLDMRGVESLEILNSMTSDRAWEAAKQSAPKLMDFIHEGSKSDAARLYDALGLTASEDLSDNLKETKFNIEHSNAWSAILQSNQFMSKHPPIRWDQASIKQESTLNKIQNNVLLTDNNIVNSELEISTYKPSDIDDQTDIGVSKNEETKQNTRGPNFDQIGNYIKDENKKKNCGKTKVATSGTWYHPKKKKPLTNDIVKKFESVIFHLSQIHESAFIEHDMDIKVAPRFYEVVKHPMCLNDILTKLKNSSYTEYDHVVQDFKRIFNNVRLYLKTYPDSVMKRNVHKVSSEFERILNEEFQNKSDAKNKSYDSNKKTESENESIKSEAQKDEIKKDSKSHKDNK